MLGRVAHYPPPPGPGHPPSAWYGSGGDQLATWALVIAIVSLVLTCCCGPVSLAGGIAAVLMAIQVRRRAAWAGWAPDLSTANAAFWVGIAAIAAGVVSLGLSIVTFIVDLGTW